MVLIDREDICDVSICEGISCSKCSFLNKADNVTCLLRKRVFELKTVDAVPVVHGHWGRDDSTGEVRCSKCKDLVGVTSEYTYNELVSNLHYCSNCGAIMDGEHGN